jgi:drug/metabolite transporter (DMT)-like permease
MKKGLNTFTFVQVGAMRIFISFLIFLPISIKNIKYLKKENIIFIIGCGFLGTFIPAFLFTFAGSKIPSALSGTLNGLTPFFVLIIGVLAFKSKPSILQYTGILIGFIGATFLVTNGDFNSFESINIYALPVVFATSLYGINANMVKHKLQELEGIQISSLTFLFMGIPAGIVLFSTDISPVFQSPVLLPSFLAVLFLAIFGSVITSIIYFNLIHKTGAIFPSLATYIMPFFALI